MGVLTSGKTDLYSLHNYIQNTLISSPKEIMVESLRKFFSQDSFYHYQKDQWGFPLTPDHTDLPIESGLNDNVTTMIILPIGTIAGFHPFPASFATSLTVITSAHDRLVTLTV